MKESLTASMSMPDSCAEGNKRSSPDLWQSSMVADEISANEFRASL